jgi:hypothetical protein
MHECGDFRVGGQVDQKVGADTAEDGEIELGSALSFA